MRRSRLLLALLLLPLLAVPALAASSKYTDPVYGFTMKLPDRDWSQTPTQPGEKLEVAKFKDDRKGNFSTLSIFRFEVSDSGTTTPGEGETDDPAEVPEARRWRGRELPKSAAEKLNSDMGLMHKRMGMEWGGLPEPKEAKFGKLKGKIYAFEFENKQWRVKRGYLAGIVSDGQEEYLLLYMHPNKLKKMVRAWTRSLRSFRFADEDAELGIDEEDIEDRDKTRSKDAADFLDPEKRAKVKLGLRGGWRFIDTHNYLVIYNCDDGLAKYIAKRVEYMRERAFETVFPPVAPFEECMIVRVCKEMDEYYHYGAPRGSAGYWSSGHDELVFPDLSQSTKPDEKTIGVMHHEAFHQYIHYALLKNNLPIWFNEGFAEYFFCVEGWGKKSLAFMDRHPMRHSVVKSALGEGKLVPLKDFLKMDQPHYYARANLCYAQGWAFATWMKNITKDERYQRIPEVMFQEMQKGYLERAGGDPTGRGYGGGGWQEYNPVVKAAMEKAFEGIDIDEMEEAFHKDLKKKM